MFKRKNQDDSLGDFSHSNLRAILKLPADTTFQNHQVTHNRNNH